MAHKTFISYKFSESADLRDRIIKAMGEDAIYYKGENGFSPNKSDDSDDAIWNFINNLTEESIKEKQIMAASIDKNELINVNDEFFSKLETIIKS